MNGWIKYGEHPTVNLDNVISMGQVVHNTLNHDGFFHAQIQFQYSGDCLMWTFSDEQEYRAVLAEVHKLIDAKVISINPE